MGAHRTKASEWTCGTTETGARAWRCCVCDWRGPWAPGATRLVLIPGPRTGNSALGHDEYVVCSRACELALVGDDDTPEPEDADRLATLWDSLGTQERITFGRTRWERHHDNHLAAAPQLAAKGLIERVIVDSRRSWALTPLGVCLSEWRAETKASRRRPRR